MGLEQYKTGEQSISKDDAVEKLKEMGADYVQGFYYSKPITRDDFLGILNDSQRRK